MTPQLDRTVLRQLLGEQRHEIIETRAVGGLGAAQRLAFTLEDRTEIPALFLRPQSDAPAPAILYCHAHGNAYEIGADEVILGRPALTAPYGPALAQAGYAVLCLEMPCFGARADPTEGSRAKADLWHGRPLFGRMLAELAAGLRWLAQQPGVDATRIATLGLSMGGTHAWWMAALEPRIAAAVHLCCLSDLATLVASGAHDGHGLYMVVPGLLPVARTGQIAGLIAPRPQFLGAGLRDWSTPEDALKIALTDLRAAYHGAETALVTHIEPDLGHAESPAMREAVMAFLDRHLRGPRD